jgi:hypothetical protein
MICGGASLRFAGRRWRAYSWGCRRYLEKLIAAARESGYAVAAPRVDGLEAEIRPYAERAFEFEPATSLGVAVQAQAMLGLGFYHKKHHSFARKLATGAIRVAS